MLIRSVATQDIASLVDIYNDYIENTVVTFEEERISPDDMGARIAKVSESLLPWLVLESDHAEVLGFAYADSWHGRSAYRYTAESTIYLASKAIGQGQGRILYSSLIERLRQRDIKQVIGRIALPNEPSVGLHSSLGFEKVGEVKNVGFKFDQWISVGYWQRAL